MKKMTAHVKKKATLLAVDDMPANLIALEAVLGSEYHLVLANSGEEALELFNARNDFDLILMDLQMPGMDGFETAARIKRTEHGKDIPIIFITAIYKEEPFVRKGYEVGAVDYFSKPFDPEILKMKVGIYSAFRQKAAILREREIQIRESEELLKAGRKLSSILESLPVGVLIADVEGRVCQTNEAVGRILKSTEFAENDAYGKILGWWGMEGQLIKDQRAPLYRAIHSGEASHNELMPVRCIDGTEKMILGSASPLRAKDGHIVGAVVVIQDVTEPKKIELDLESRITKLVSLGIEFEHHAN
jgi:PAS domain S-box-containing protein